MSCLLYCLLKVERGQNWNEYDEMDLWVYSEVKKERCSELCEQLGLEPVSLVIM